MTKNLKLSIYDSISSIDRDQYNEIVDPENPFLEYEFLEALEISQVIGLSTTWSPRYIILRDNGSIVGAITCYKKFDSYGEYIFDWEWARAFESAGLPYYPKMLVAIPFTPATGTRILVHPEYSFESIAKQLVEGLIKLSTEEKCSSVHVLFLTDREYKLLENCNFLTRKTHQYHWKNMGLINKIVW